MIFGGREGEAGEEQGREACLSTPVPESIKVSVPSKAGDKKVALKSFLFPPPPTAHLWRPGSNALGWRDRAFSAGRERRGLLAVEGCEEPKGPKVEPTREVARSELGAGLGRAGAPGHPEDGLGGPSVHSLQLTALLPPPAAGVGTVPLSGAASPAG